MAPKKDIVPRKRSGQLVRFEPDNTEIIDKEPNFVDSFKHVGCWKFCQKLQGHHLEVSRDFVKNYKHGKTKVGPLEINLTADLISEVTKIPRSGEQWFKKMKIEKEEWCLNMLKQEFKDENLSKGIIKHALLEQHEKLLFVIRKFFTCEGRFSWVQQYHLKLLFHFTHKKEIDMPFYLFKSMQRMIKGAQMNPARLEKLIFHHGLIKLIVLEQLQKEGKDWKTFLFVSNFQIELPTVLSPIKKVKKYETSSPIVVVKKEPSSSTVPKDEGSSPTDNLKKLKGKAKQGHEEEDLEEKSAKLPLEPPQEVHMEV